MYVQKETALLIGAAQKLVDYFDYHNKNLNKGQEAALCDLKDALENVLKGIQEG